MSTESTASTGISVEKPKSFLFRDVQVDGKALFKSIFKATSHFVSGKPEEMISDGGEALAALGLGTEPGQIAWLLVFRSVVRSMRALVKSNALLFSDSQPPFTFSEETNEALGKVELAVDKDFFLRPRYLTIVPVAQAVFLRWLVQNQVPEAKAKTIADRFPAYFVDEISNEWRDNSQAYAVLLKSLDTPFQEAVEREKAWVRYYAFLQRQISEDMFDEPFSLSQIYIPLRAYSVEKAAGSYEKDELDSRRGKGEEARHIRRVVKLQEELDNWLAKSDRNDSLRILSGGPGSGKSSFTKIYAEHLSRNPDIRVLFIPLHQFDPKGDLGDSIVMDESTWILGRLHF